MSKAAAKPKTMPKERATCPLCQAELNMGSKGPANYNTCTTCKLQVCNLCGFNPTPHLVEVRELGPWGAQGEWEPERAAESWFCSCRRAFFCALLPSPNFHSEN